MPARVGMANALDASAIFVYTRRGYMANFLSRCRPDAPIFAFTGAMRNYLMEPRHFVTRTSDP